ncbi:hypothetical protein ACHAXR_005474 [Thalassiosira sp. AJA248-18]
MGFPIKKRITTPVPMNESDQPSAPSGLDLLSAAIDSCPKRAPPKPKGSSESVALEEKTAGDNGDSSSVHSTTKVAHQAMVDSYNDTHKRAKTFPEVLLDIVSNPDYAPMVSWLPNGKSFAIHDPCRFSAEILPKYFRRVIFRSFVRKLNRWGFRSVKRSVSGFESTFEHKCFCREQPELCAKMYCKSNPATKPLPSIATSNSTSTAGNINTIVSPSTSADSILSIMAAASAANVPPPQISQPFINSRNEEFPRQLPNSLLLLEIEQQRQRQQALMQLVNQRPMPDSDVVSQYVAEKWRLIMANQLQGGGGYSRTSGF